MNYRTFLNPFEKYNEKKLLLIGGIATLAGGFLSYAFTGCFDAALHLSYVNVVSIQQAFSDTLLICLALFLCLFGVGKIINRKTRPIDILNTVLIARIPQYLLLFANIGHFMEYTQETLLKFAGPENLTVANPDIPLGTFIVILVFAFVSILLLIWFIVLLYQGFKVAVNTKTTAHKFYFAGALILGDILSRILLAYSPFN